LTIFSTGPNGEENINSMLFAVTTESVARLSQSSIYNCSTRRLLIREFSYERGCQEKLSLAPPQGEFVWLASSPMSETGRDLAGCGYISSVSCFRWWFDAVGS